MDSRVLLFMDSIHIIHFIAGFPNFFLLASVMQRRSRGQILSFTSRDLAGREDHHSQITQLHIMVDWSSCRRRTFLWPRLMFALQASD